MASQRTSRFEHVMLSSFSLPPTVALFCGSVRLGELNLVVDFLGCFGDCSASAQHTRAGFDGMALMTAIKTSVHIACQLLERVYTVHAECTPCIPAIRTSVHRACQLLERVYTVHAECTPCIPAIRTSVHRACQLLERVHTV
jgi:hypothetical protein